MAEDVEQRPDRPRPGRRRYAAGLAVAAAVLAIGAPAVLAARYRSGAPAPAERAPAAAAPAPAGELTPRSLPAGAGELTPPSLPAGAGELTPPSLPAGAGRTGATTPAVPDPGDVKGMPDEDGCPVTLPRLLAALRASDLRKDLAGAGDLSEVDCYGTYAGARARPVTAGAATVLFRYTELTDSWQAVGGGDPDACAQVPAAVRSHLRACR
ncbi:hypothetical protein GCM10020358_31530 [Amorphoplanes nipponensis]|uniref:Uncharacterized protein n=1 Tax=Actinoplanes nipponensis TaxID=135950 RepID=A0A919JJH5_9ACTN|nr:hypothetical protein [Actinoplanes nipponensis]GIE50813.1 hypothetical protein Ani05nite_43470 [Actinoplanes nipponensis]